MYDVWYVWMYGMYGCMDVWMYGLRDCVKEMMMFWFSSHDYLANWMDVWDG